MRIPKPIARIGLVLLTPVLVLGLLEAALTWQGFGEDASFFHVVDEGGRRLVRSNPTFTRRFLPAGMDRIPLPVEIPAAKGPGVVRVVVVGSSAALGDPEPAFGIARHIDVLLHARFPGTTFEVVNTGLTGVNSHVIREVAADLPDVSPDLVVLYTGNNEVVGPWGPGSAVTSWEPPPWVIRARTFVLGTRTGQLVSAIFARLGGASGPRAWQGMRMFLDRQVAPDDPRLDDVRDRFRANLDALIASSVSAGAAVVVCSLPANLRDCAPFASAAPHDASGRYREGKALLDAGRADDARAPLGDALEWDRLRFRATVAVDAVTREAALAASSLGSPVAFADIRAFLAADDPDSLPGRALLHDHVHLTFRGNYLAALGVVERATSLLSIRGLEPSGRVPGESEVASALAYTSWDELGILEKMRERKAEPPFTNQVDHETDLALLDSAIARLRARPETDALPGWLAAYESAIAARPRDPYLLERQAALHVLYGNPLDAIAPLKRLVAAWPGYENAHVNLAVALARAGRLREAEERLREALGRFPNGTVTLEMWADFLGSHGRDREAAEALRTGLDRGVSPPRFQHRLAQVLATSRDRAIRNGPEAVRMAEAAVASIGPSNLAVQSTLAAAYAADGQYARAAELQQRILAMVEAQGVAAPVDELRARLALYRSGKGVGE